MKTGVPVERLLCYPLPGVYHRRFVMLLDSATLPDAAKIRRVGQVLPRFILLPLQVGPFEGLLVSAVGAGDMIAALVALFPSLLNAANSSRRWRRSEDDFPVPKGFRALDAQGDLVAFVACARRRISINLIEGDNAGGDTAKAARTICANKRD